VEKSLKDEAKKAKDTRGNHKGMVVVPYVKGLSEAFARILKFHGITTANRPHRTLWNFVVHPKDKVRDEEKTELIYRVPCKNCFRSYVRETGWTFGLRIKEHKKEVDCFTASVQRQTRWIKEALWIRKTPSCMNRDAGSYQLSHTWDQVIFRSRALSGCKQSRRDQDVRRTSKRCH